MRRRRRRTISCLIFRSTSSIIILCYVCCCCLAAVLPETTSHEDRIEDRIQRTTEERTSADDDDGAELMSVTTEWNHLFYGLKENTDKGMESTDIFKDNAHAENDKVATYSEKRDFSVIPGEEISRQRKNILEGHVFPKGSTTRNRPNIVEKDLLNESGRGQREPSVLGHLSDGRAVGTRGRHRSRRSEASIDDGTLEDLFGDALVFSERALRSKLRKSKVAVSGKVEDEQMNFDADQEAMEAAEEDNLEKRDANEVAISKTVIKDMEDTVFGHALDYIKNNSLEPSKHINNNSVSSLTTDNTLNATHNNDSSNANVTVTPHEGITLGNEGNKTTMHKQMEGMEGNATSIGPLLSTEEPGHHEESNGTVLGKTAEGEKPVMKEEAGKKEGSELEKKEMEEKEKEDKTEVGKKQRTKMTFNDWMKMKHKKIRKNESRSESEKGSSKKKGVEQKSGVKSVEKKARKESTKLKKGAKKKKRKKQLKKSGKASVKNRKKKSLPETETYVKLANRGHQDRPSYAEKGVRPKRTDPIKDIVKFPFLHTTKTEKLRSTET